MVVMALRKGLFSGFIFLLYLDRLFCDMLKKKSEGIWRTCLMGLSMSFSSLIFESTSVSDDMTFCAGWAGVLVE